MELLSNLLPFFVVYSVTVALSPEVGLWLLGRVFVVEDGGVVSYARVRADVVAVADDGEIFIYVWRNFPFPWMSGLLPQRCDSDSILSDYDHLILDGNYSSQYLFDPLGYLFGGSRVEPQ